MEEGITQIAPERFIGGAGGGHELCPPCSTSRTFGVDYQFQWFLTREFWGINHVENAISKTLSVSPDALTQMETFL